MDLPEGFLPISGLGSGLLVFNRVFSSPPPCKRSDINRFSVSRPRMLRYLSQFYSFIQNIHTP
jgi:hypothetical protein